MSELGQTGPSGRRGTSFHFRSTLNPDRKFSASGTASLDHLASARLLRSRRERPGHGRAAADKCDEVATVHADMAFQAVGSVSAV
jgi:hypothetical protein